MCACACNKHIDIVAIMRFPFAVGVYKHDLGFSPVIDIKTVWWLDDFI